MTLLVSRVLSERALRERLFPGMREPAWIILLTLWESSESLSVTHVCYSAHTPYTTALRHVDRLERKGLIERADNPEDKRGTLLSLTDRARGKLATFSSFAGRLAA